MNQLYNLSNCKEVLSVKDVMTILTIGKNSTYKLLNEHKIKNIRIGNKIIIPKKCLEEYLQSAD